MTMKNNSMMNCKTCTALLPDLLLDAEFGKSHAGAAAHLKACADCRSEYEGLRATFALMDEWTAPEPTPYFDTRLQARLREEVAAQPEGFFERIRSFVLFSTGRQFRPIVAGALGCVLVLGGAGTFAGVYQPWNHAPTSATVNDLKILDNNAQAEQQLNQLLDDGGSSDDSGAAPTT